MIRKKRRTFWAVFASLFLSVGMIFSFFFMKRQKEKRLQDPYYYIQSIVQTGPQKEALKTSFLAELLELSIDKPIPIDAIDLKKAEEKLLSSPLIASAKIKRIYPSSLYIDYEVRKPIAWVGDFKNLAIDETGAVFPVHPFLTPKRIPEIYFGLGGEIQRAVEGDKFDLALKVLKTLEEAPWKEGVRIQRVDVSNAFHPSLGQRELVILTEEEVFLQTEEKEKLYIFPKMLRLSPKGYEAQLKHFFTLRRQIMNDYQKQLQTTQKEGRFSPRIVDLRIPQLAFVEKGESF